MSGGATAVMAVAAVAGAAIAYNNGQEQKKAAEKASQQAQANAAKQEAQADQAFNQANQKKPDTSAILSAAQQSGKSGASGTMLIEADRLKADNGQRLAEIEAGKVMGAAEIQALIEATKAQGQLTGIKVVDTFNSLMRPTITFWWVIVLQTAVMGTTFYLAIDAGKPLLDAIGLVWGPAEKAIVASIVSFWFVDRSLRKPQ